MYEMLGFLIILKYVKNVFVVVRDGVFLSGLWKFWVVCMVLISDIVVWMILWFF